MSDTVKHIQAKIRINREKEKIEKESRKKTRDYLYENLNILNELSYLVHENHDKRFAEIYEEYLRGRAEDYGE